MSHLLQAQIPCYWLDRIRRITSFRWDSGCVGVAAISSADVGHVRSLVSEKRSPFLLNAYDNAVSSTYNVAGFGVCVAFDAAMCVDGSVSRQLAGGGSRTFNGKTPCTVVTLIRRDQGYHRRKTCKTWGQLMRYSGSDRIALFFPREVTQVYTISIGLNKEMFHSTEGKRLFAYVTPQVEG